MKKIKHILLVAGISLVMSISHDSNTWFLGLGIHDAFAQDEGHSSVSVPAEKIGEQKKPEQQKTEPAKEREPTEETPTVEVPVDKQQLIGLRTTQASFQQTRKIIRTVGKVEYDEKKLATVNVHFEAWIEKLYADYVGKYVHKGEPLAEVYSHELYATEQEYINALKWNKELSDAKDDRVNSMLARDSEAIVRAARERLMQWDISEEQIKTIAETGKPTRTFTIYSPISGYIVQKVAIQGMRVMPGDKLYDIADLSTVWIISDIYEYELPLIRTGETARITLSYFPGREFTAHIDYVYPVLAGETRTAKVRMSIPNLGNLLKPQMFTNVEIKIGTGRKLVIPEDAVIDTGTKQIVYVDKGDGNFEPREVTVGLRSDGMVEVVKGLKAKEKVAASATFLIDSEARLKGVVK